MTPAYRCGVKYPIAAFSASGLVSDSGGQPDLAILNVNSNNTITSKASIVANVTSGTLATSANLVFTGRTYALSITNKTNSSITFSAIDIHNTPFAPGEAVALIISDGTNNIAKSFTLKSATDYEYTVSTAIGYKKR